VLEEISINFVPS